METFKSTVATCVAVECLMLMDYLPGSKPPPLEEMVANELPNVLNAVVPDVHYHCADPAAYLESVTQKITDFEHATERISSRAYTGVTLSLLRFTKRGPTAAPEKVRDVAREVARILGAPDISKKVELAYEAVFCALVRAP
jgi:hypothetical protein